MRPLWLILALILLFCAACDSPTPPADTGSPAVPTAAPSQTLTASPTFTLIPPTLTPTLVSFEGTLTIKVNVRSGPATTFDSLGQLNSGEKVQVLHQDKSGSWLEILYPSAPLGRGWVSAQYVQLPAGVQVPLDATHTPTGPTGLVTQRLNVRSGPATTFDSLGVLEPRAVVSLTGKNATASWFQVVYPAAPSGLGWVTAQYIQTDSAPNLPVLDDFGTPVPVTTAIGTPSGPFLAPTPTIGPAFLDGDSRLNPSVEVTFSASGPRRFTFSSQVSSPEGDPEDWIAFTPNTSIGSDASLLLSLVCAGRGSLTVELWQGASLVPSWGSLACGDVEKPVILAAGKPYALRLAPVSTSVLSLIDYTLIISNQP